MFLLFILGTIFFMCGKGVGWESPLVTLSITTTILQNKEAILVTRMAGSVFEKACFPIVNTIYYLGRKRGCVTISFYSVIPM